MRANSGMDQAEGLRQLLVRHGVAEPLDAEVSGSNLLPQVITVAGGKPGGGRTSATINFAAALARSGKDVLVLDENRAPNNSLDRLGLRARYDLLDVVQGKCAPREAILTSRGISVLSTARAMSALATLKQAEQLRLEKALAEMSNCVDVMLVDAAMLNGRAAVSSSMASPAVLLVVVDVTSSGITESYALIKRLALENARLHFGIVVNRAPDEKAAIRVFDNMAIVAHRKLAARLEYLGYIPPDDRLKRATQLGRPVVEAFPAAVSAKSYMDLSQKLLRLLYRQGETEGGISNVMKNLILQLRSGEIAHVVN